MSARQGHVELPQVCQELGRGRDLLPRQEVLEVRDRALQRWELLKIRLYKRHEVLVRFFFLSSSNDT